MLTLPPERQIAKAGLPLTQAGGIPSKTIEVEASVIKAARATITNDVRLEPSLSSALRPQTVRQWMLPYLAALTPQYVEQLLKGMLYGSHVAGMELFTIMIDTDPEICSCVQEWTEGVMDKKVQIEPYHEEDEEPSPSAVEKHKVVGAALRNMRPDLSRDENDLRNTIKDILFARFHGISVLETDWHDTYGTGDRYIKDVPGLGPVQCVRSTYWVHPVCYGLDTEYRLGLNVSMSSLANKTKMYSKDKLNYGGDNYGFGVTYNQPTKDLVMEFPTDKFLIGIHKTKTGSMLGGSCLRPLAWWWIASNFCGDWLLKYAELFGVPLRKATWKAGTSATEKEEIKQLLQASGSAPWVLLPETADLEFIDRMQGGAQSPQAFLFEFADRQKRKVILHQTMTGQSSTSGKGFGITEENVKSDCIDSGARFAESILNLQLVPSILKLNYGDGGDLEAPTVKLVDVEVGNLGDAQRDQILTTIIDVPESHLHRKYGVPRPNEGEKIAGKDVGTVAAAAQAAKEQAAAIAKAQADAAQQAKENPAGGAGAAGEGDEPKPPGEVDDIGTGTEARRAIEAANSKAGCLMAMLPSLDSSLPNWAGDNIPAHTLAADGIEVEPHVTVLYGFNVGFDATQLESILKERGAFDIRVGKLSRFEGTEYDVIKFEIGSPELEALNKRLAGQFFDEITLGDHGYHPHLTVAYVKPGTNKELDGSKFEGAVLRVQQFLYSEPNETHRFAFDARLAIITDEARHSLYAAESEMAGVKVVAETLHSTVEPMLKRLKAISDVDDVETRRGLLVKFLKDHEKITAAMLHDESLADAVSVGAVEKFLAGLKAKP